MSLSANARESTILYTLKTSLVMLILTQMSVQAAPPKPSDRSSPDRDPNEPGIRLEIREVEESNSAGSDSPSPANPPSTIEYLRNLFGLNNIGNLVISSKDGLVVRGQEDSELRRQIENHSSSLETLSSLLERVELLIDSATDRPDDQNYDSAPALQDVNELGVLLIVMREIDSTGFESDRTYQNALQRLLTSMQTLAQIYEERIPYNIDSLSVVRIHFSKLGSTITKALSRNVIDKTKLKLILKQAQQTAKAIKKSEDDKKKQVLLKKKKKKKKKKKNQSSHENDNRSRQSQQESMDEMIARALDYDETKASVSIWDGDVPHIINLSERHRLRLSVEARSNLRGLRTDHRLDHIVPLDYMIIAAKKHLKKPCQMNMNKFVYNFFDDATHSYYRFVFVGDSETEAVLLTAFKVSSNNVRRDGLNSKNCRQI